MTEIIYIPKEKTKQNKYDITLHSITFLIQAYSLFFLSNETGLLSSSTDQFVVAVIMIYNHFGYLMPEAIIKSHETWGLSSDGD